MADLDLERDQKAFAQQAKEYRQQWLADLPDEADSQWDESTRIAQRWAASGRACELLTPLLDDPSTAVRYSAASCLTRLCPSERAWDALHEVRERATPDEVIFKVWAGALLKMAGRM
jgi:hypothetical protein